MNDDRAYELIYIAGLIKGAWFNTLTDEEYEYLENWKNKSDKNRELADKINKRGRISEELSSFEQFDIDRATNQFLTETGLKDKTVNNAVIRTFSNKFWRWSAAAAVVFFVSAGWYFFSNIKDSNTNLQKTAKTATYNFVKPGGNKAILTLSDGAQVVLDSIGNGLIRTDGNVNIVKLEDGKLSYSGSDENETSKQQYNTITTPRGGKYQITLPDGTGVWLNSASSITFPTSFSGNERLVKISGEAYFEVTHQHSKESTELMPFVVEVATSRITVLGTRFNINAYADEEALRTTLVEGSVKISNGKNTTIIIPGEQASLKAGEANYKIVHPDIEEVLAWKNGKFLFRNANVQSIMRQLSRWYDIDIHSTEDLSGISFSGGISRKDRIEKLLELLELDGRLKFTLNGNVLTVTRRK